jgi:UDP-glucuronate 4-epimerase
MTILVTGCAGFIGFHLAQRLLQAGQQVVGIDNVTPYYDVRLKRARLQKLHDLGLACAEFDLADNHQVQAFFAAQQPDYVVHLAAQAGVRYAFSQPQSYVQSNLVAFANLLEALRAYPPKHTLFASTSSVYGLNGKMPFRESDSTDHPLSFYAATKKANESMSHAYAHLFGIPMTGVRFFTVYGPWGRPDMALFKFTEAILAGRPIEVFNHGKHQRDFTYIDDVVEGLVQLLALPPSKNPEFNNNPPDISQSSAPWRVLNIGNAQPVALMDYIATLEQLLGRQAEKIMLPLQPGDVPANYADTSALQKLTGYKPSTSVTLGVARFVEWFLGDYQRMRSDFS